MIVIKDLRKSFRGQFVLDGVSTSIQQGEIVAILGSSGSGKSTLLRCINHLEEPTSGDIFLDGVQVTPATIQNVRTRVGMVFQNFHLFPHMDVLRNLTYAPIKIKGLNQEAAIEKAKTLLKQVGLIEKADAYPNTLSGGQKQRVAIARALMMDPEIILFDEPTSALDPEMVQEVLKVMKSLSATGITMLIVTHEMGFVREVAERVLFLESGKILEDRKTDEFFNSHINDRIALFLNKKSNDS